MTNAERIMHMPKWKSALLGATLVLAPVSAQAHSGSSVTALEPTSDRLAAATQLMDLIMPAAQRDAMVEQMVSAIMSTMTASIKEQPALAKALQDPKVEAVFDRFVDRQQTKTSEQLKTEMPGMLSAMSRAYARRFTTAQLAELHAFFGTPTGQLYARESLGILSDPDIIAWQRNLMTKSFDKLPGEVDTLVQELEEVLGKPIGESKA